MSAPDKPRRKRRRTEHEEPRETGAPVVPAVLHRAQEFGIPADDALAEVQNPQPGFKPSAPALVEVAPSTFAYDPVVANQAQQVLQHIAAAMEQWGPIRKLQSDEFPSERFVFPSRNGDAFDVGPVVGAALNEFLGDGREVDAWAVRDGYLVVVTYPDAQKRRFRL